MLLPDISLHKPIQVESAEVAVAMDPSDEQLPVTRERQSRLKSSGLRSFARLRETDIRERYEFGDTDNIGAGAYGSVYLAKDKQFNNRVVAIKKVTIPKNAASNTEKAKEAKETFYTEVEIMQNLDHPNICKLLETYDRGRFMFFVMEYCAGKELFDRIEQRGSIDEPNSVEIIKQAGSALKYAHNQGVAHRDIKPENIVFCSTDLTSNDIKVIDWGVGFYFGHGSMHDLLGTLTYAAPEVLEANPTKGYTCACDAFSLGVVTYIMLCGTIPFAGGIVQHLNAMKQESYIMSGPVWDKVSDAAKDFVRSLLKPDPSKRMSMSAMMEHEWLRVASHMANPQISKTVFMNLQQFNNTSRFVSLCTGVVARQLDHEKIKDVKQVFRQMDTNGDGMLDFQEIKAGFEKILGSDSCSTAELEEMFHRIDMDKSGKIDYTEFCAAGIGQHCLLEDDALWAAYQDFNTRSDGPLRRSILEDAIAQSDVIHQKSQSLHEDLEKLDRRTAGHISFEDWVDFLRGGTTLARISERKHDETESCIGALACCVANDRPPASDVDESSDDEDNKDDNSCSIL